MERQTPSRAVLGGLLDLVLPRRCVGCGVAGEWLCPECVTGLRPLPEDVCPQCGAPGGQAAGRCRECRERQLWFVSASAAFAYEDAARALVTACKFRAYRSLTTDMARRALPSFLATCRRLGGEDGGPLVTWVPGHRDHVLERGFNQAELLARELARLAGLPSVSLLRRVRHGARQSGLGRAARAANARNTFALREDADRVRKRLQRVMIVDDVYTTGETLSHCAAVLINADYEPHAFTFARTVRAVPTQTTLDDAVRKERCR
jgi:competence protein ComFC